MSRERENESERASVDKTLKKTQSFRQNEKKER